MRYKYLYTLTHLGTVQVLRNPNEYSAQTQLVVVVATPTACAKNIEKMHKKQKCKSQIFWKPSQYQNPQKTRTFKNIKQNLKNIENVFKNEKKKKNQINKKGIKGKNLTKN